MRGKSMFAVPSVVRISLCRALSFVIAIVLLPACFAQTVTTGEVTGTASDTTGAVVPSAVVTLKSVDTGETRAVVSSSTGLYRFTFVRPGAYQLSASGGGLRSDVTRVVVG